MRQLIICIQWLTTFGWRLKNALLMTVRVSHRERLDEVIRLKRETGFSVLLIANHLSASDPFIITGTFPARLKSIIFPIWFLAKKELFETRSGDRVMRLLGCLPIGYGRGQNVREVIRLVTSNETVCLFPEGQVSLDGGFGPDLGAVTLFSRFSPLIVFPIRLDGFLGSNSFPADLRLILRRKRTVHITYGHPFVLDKGSPLDAVEIIKRIEPQPE